MNYDRYRGKSPQRKKRYWLTALLALFIAGALVFTALELFIYHGAQGRTVENSGGPEVMVIFGCQVRRDGPSVLLKDRLDTALVYLEEHPETRVVVAGAQGDDEPVSEAQFMCGYLTDRGVSESKILLEDRSHNTHQNIRYTLELLDGGPFWDAAVTPGQCGYILVSNDFHLSRILMLWERATGRLDNVSTLAAPCSHFPSRVKMFLREPVALVKSFFLDR